MAGPLIADRARETTTTTGTGTVDLAGAVTGFQTLVAAIGTGNTCYYCIDLESAGEWEVGIGTVTDATPDTLSRTTVLASSNAGSLVSFSAGTKRVFVTAPASQISPIIRSTQDFRLTTESGVPVSTSDRTSQSTIYLTPFTGNQIALYTGSAWELLSSAEVSLALSSLTSGKNYDVFAYNNSGTLTLELSAAWSTDIARTDALTTQDGVYVKSGTATRRYIGTIRTTSTSTTEDSAAKRFVWNVDNQKERKLTKVETAVTWTYDTATWRSRNASTSNRVEIVVGLTGNEFWLSITNAFQTPASANSFLAAGIGINTTSANDAEICGRSGVVGAINIEIQEYAQITSPPRLGYSYYQAVEYVEGGNTLTILGTDNTGNDRFQTGLLGHIAC